MVRKASVCGGLAVAAVASGLLLASPVHAQTRTTTPAGGQILAGAAGNIGSLVASDGDRRRRQRVSSVGGVGNVTGSEGATGGVTNSRVTGSGNVSERGTRQRTRPGLEQRVRRLERETSSVGGVGNVTGSERARGGVRQSTISESGNVTRARRGRMERPLSPRMERRIRTIPRERGEISSVGGVGNVTGSERARGGVTGSEVIGSGNVRGGGMERSRGESGVSSVGGVGNVTGSEGATGGVSGSTIENSGNVE